MVYPGKHQVLICTAAAGVMCQRSEECHMCPGRSFCETVLFIGCMKGKVQSGERFIPDVSNSKEKVKERERDGRRSEGSVSIDRVTKL